MVCLELSDFGEDVCNLIRKAILTRVHALRPIAFKVGENSNVVSCGDAVLEDMTAFINNISSHVVSPNVSQEVFHINVTVDGEVRMSDILKDSGIEMCTEDSIVCTTLSPITIEIIFRYSVGKKSQQDNIYFLEKQRLVDVKKFVVIQSNHSNVEAVTFEVIKKDSDVSRYKFYIKTKDNFTEDQIMDEAIAQIKNELVSAEFNRF